MPERIIIAAARGSHRAAQAAQRLLKRGGPLTPIIIKAIIFGLLLLYVQAAQFSFWPIVLFVLVALFLYSQPVFKAFTFTTSLFLVLALSLLLTSRFTITVPGELGGAGEWLFAAGFSFLFFLLMGIKNFALVRRPQWYAVLFIVLTYGIGLLLFTSISTSPLPSMILFALFTALLIREYFDLAEHRRSRALFVIVLTLSLVLAESAWALSLLPIGFAKAASALTLFSMMTVGIVDRYLGGTLSARFLRVNLSLIIGLTAIIFLSSRWII